MEARRRLLHIDLGKGIGIFLVVVGHIVARQPPDGNQWFMVIKTLIYTFHMPFFMYLSGFVFFYSGRTALDSAAYGRNIARTANRLLVPFLVFGLVTIAGKLVFSHFMHVDRTPSSLGSALLGMFVHTNNSPATAVWYLFVLFVYSALVPLGGAFFNRWPWLVLAASLALWAIPVPAIAYVDRICHFLLFFMLGMTVAKYSDQALPWITRSRFVLWLLFAAGLAAFWQFGIPALSLACALLGTLALHSACLALETVSPARIRPIALLGEYSLVIYLLNTIAIGLAKGVLLKFFSWDFGGFAIFLPVLLLSGLLIPMLVRIGIERTSPRAALYLR